MRLLLAVLTVAAVICTASTVSMDPVTTKDLQEAIKQDELVISLKYIKPRRRLRGSVETLFAVDFPGSQQKFVLMLDRRTKRIILETIEEGRTRAQHITVDTLTESTVIRSLILSINQKSPGKHINFIMDCVFKGKIATPLSMKDMFATMKKPELQVFRERRYPVEVDAHQKLNFILNRNNCPLPDDDQMQAIQPSVNEIPYRRGDIPLIHELNDETLLKTLNELINVVKYLKVEVEYGRQEIKQIRQIMHDCEICKHRPAEIKISCANNPNPCFPGVQCHDSAEGPRCGQCPRGYIGDGRQCRRGRTCEDRPCFSGVRCYDTVEGYRCGPCPQGYEGNGEQCVRRSGCEYNPCHPGYYKVRC